MVLLMELLLDLWALCFSISLKVSQAPCEENWHWQLVFMIPSKGGTESLKWIHSGDKVEWVLRISNQSESSNCSLFGYMPSLGPHFNPQLWVGQLSLPEQPHSLPELPWDKPKVFSCFRPQLLPLLGLCFCGCQNCSPSGLLVPVCCFRRPPGF